VVQLPLRLQRYRSSEPITLGFHISGEFITIFDLSIRIDTRLHNQTLLPVSDTFTEIEVPCTNSIGASSSAEFMAEPRNSLIELETMSLETATQLPLPDLS
jgi:hypothetical protein